MLDGFILRQGWKIYATRLMPKLFTFKSKPLFNDHIWSFVDFCKRLTIKYELRGSPNYTGAFRDYVRAEKQGFKFVGPVCVYSFLEAVILSMTMKIIVDWK